MGQELWGWQQYSTLLTTHLFSFTTHAFNFGMFWFQIKLETHAGTVRETNV